MKTLSYVLLINLIILPGQSFARNCIDEIAAIETFSEMHREMDHIFDYESEYQYTLKNFGKDYLCSPTFLHSYTENFKYDEEDRSLIKKKLKQSGIINDEVYFRGVIQGATEQDVCDIADMKIKTFQLPRSLLAEFSRQRLYYDHEKHCRLHLDYFMKIRVKKLSNAKTSKNK